MTLKILLAAVLLAFFSISCETPTDQTIESARTCTNNAAQIALSGASGAIATAANAAQLCEQIITNAGLTSAEAKKIQFGAVLIEDQILSNVGQAAVAQKNNTGGQAGISTMLPLLLPTPLAGATVPNISTEGSRIQVIANATGSAGIIYIGSLINMAASVNAVSAITSCSQAGSCSQAQTQAALTTCETNSSCNTQVASAFTSMSAAACASPYDQQSTSPTDLCYQSKQIQAAAQTAAGSSTPTPQQIVTAIAAYAATNP